MKDKTYTYPISALFAFVLSFSAVGNIISGFDLPVDSLFKIALWCAVFAIGSAATLRLRHGGKIILILGCLGLIFLWKRESVWMQAQTISYIITSHYYRVYGWPILGNPAAGEVSVPLILWTALVSTGVNWHFCRRKHWIHAFLPTVLPLVLCLMTIDKVPDASYLYLTILGLSILLITDWTRRHSPNQGMKLVFRITVPVCIFLAMLFLLNPEDRYVNRAGSLQKEVIAWFEEFQDTAEDIVSGSAIETGAVEKLNLKYVGPKNNVSHSVMRVNSPINGTLYLRGRDYDKYTGTGWEASSERKEAFTTGGVSAGKISIVTYGVRSVLYVPYYATEDVELAGGAWENDNNYQRYSFYLSSVGSRNSATPEQRYCELPDETLQWAQELVKQITAGAASDRDKLRLIQNYVRSSAVYDLSTLRMDSEYADFAQWFLEESETGYCVHFATSATVLLRAAGIPARYVEGYMATCTAGENEVVSSRDAHAWAEYYDSDYGIWRVLEATPADPEEAETEPEDSIPQTETAPDDTQEETEDPGSEPGEGASKPTKPNTGGNEDPEAQGDSSGTTPGQDKEKKPFRIPDWIMTVFKCLLFAACIPLQAYVRIYRKRMLWNQGRPNARTMERWRQTRSLAKLLKQPYPEELDNLAQKAKFSQHRIQPDELRQFEEYRFLLIEQIRGMAWHYRLIAMWIFAVE